MLAQLVITLRFDLEKHLCKAEGHLATLGTSFLGVEILWVTSNSCIIESIFV